MSERSTQKEKYDPADIYKMDTQSQASSQNPPPLLQTSREFIPKTFGSTEVKTKTVTIIRNEDSDSTNSDTEYMKEAKERNLKNLKHKAMTSWKRKQDEISSTDSDNTDNEDDNAGSQQRFYMKYKTAGSSSSSSASKLQPDKKETSEPKNVQTQPDLSVGRPPKRKKSRWGPGSNSSSSSNQQKLPSNPPQAEMQPEQSNSQIQLPQIQIPQVQNAPKLTAVTRSDPALLNYARLNFGSTNLSEEDWKKAEDHFKINLLYHDMCRKRQELEMLAKNNKFKHEYDSDEDTQGGTWEHKLRNLEMEATAKWTDALNKQSEGKHHIGDFLPPEELKKFMEKYNAQKNNRQPDLSDYKEYKLKEDNIGFQMLQKLGWKQGQGLGAEGNGIVDPVNKYEYNLKKIT